MDIVNSLLIHWGYLGMLAAAFLAGSFVPFSSEAVMVGLIAAGLDPWGLVAWGSAGNILGSVFNYFVGRMGKVEWIERYLHVKPDKLRRAQRLIAGKGSWTGFFAFLPVLGSAIMITLGYMRANMLIAFSTCAAGKVVRYVILILGVDVIIGVF